MKAVRGILKATHLEPKPIAVTKPDTSPVDASTGIPIKTIMNGESELSVDRYLNKRLGVERYPEVADD